MHILCIDNPATEQPNLYREGLGFQHRVYEGVGYYKKGTTPKPPPCKPLVGIYGIKQGQQGSTYGVTATVLGFDAQQEISIDNDFSEQLSKLRNEDPSKLKLYWGNFASINREGFGILLQALRISLSKDAHLAIIVINTRDVPSYSRLGFAQIGFVKNVDGLKDAPGHLMVITKKTLEGKFLTRVGILPHELPRAGSSRRAQG